jgi:hypothetical protein
VEEDYEHPKLLYSSGHFMQVDVYVEPLRVAFEYQGAQHYRPLYFISSDLSIVKARDAEKKKACQEVQRDRYF